MNTNEYGSSDSDVNVNPATDEAEKNEIKFKLTVEIPLFLTMLAAAIVGPPVSNLIMYRTCVHSLNHSVGECRSFLASENINHTQELENEVQKHATYVNTAKSLMEALVPSILSIFIGAWSDKHGRRSMVLWPVFGIFVSAAMTTVYSLIEALGPWWITLTVVPLSLSGGFLILYTGSICYVNDISSVEKKTLRIMYVQLAYISATALGAMISPYVLRVTGNISYLLLFVTTLYAFAYSYSIIFIQESLKTATPGSMLTVVNYEHLKQMLGTNFVERPDYGRAIILLVVAASSLTIFGEIGNAGILYMYTRNKIHWSMKDFTTFSSITTAIYFSGTILGLGVFQKLLKISDLNFAMFGLTCSALEFIIKGLATNTWHMYFGSVVALFGTTSNTLLRSFITKTNAANEVGKIMFLITSTEAICPLIASITYNSLYVYTLNTFPGANFLLSAGIDMLCVMFIGIVKYLRWKAAISSYQLIDTET